VRPAHCTALGKVLLAGLDESQLEAYLVRRPPVPFTSKSITDAGLLTREIATIRQNGIAYDDGEFNSEVRCVAVPLRDLTGQVSGAIGISGAVWRLSLQALEEKSRSVRSAARRLSGDFGYVEAPERDGRSDGGQHAEGKSPR
jgi:DNA-binding IclR family transcriptional regulator